MFQFTERLGALIGRIFGKLNAILVSETGVKIKASNKVAFIGLHCTDFDMVDDEAKILSAVNPPCPSVVMLCTESKAEINAGLVIVTSSRRQRPFTVHDSAADMAIGLLDTRQQYVTSEEHDSDYDSVAASGLLWTPLASCKASQPLHWTHAWALLGEWSGHIAFPLPTLTDDGSHDWPRHGTSLRVEDWIMLWFGCLFLCRVSGHLAGGCLGSWRASPLFVCFAVAFRPWSKSFLS